MRLAGALTVNSAPSSISKPLDSVVANHPKPVGPGRKSANHKHPRRSRSMEVATHPSAAVRQQERYNQADGLNKTAGMKAAGKHDTSSRGSDQTRVQVDAEEGANDQVEYGLAWTQGYRSDMEDAHFVALKIGDRTPMPMFAVFDGHGGKDVAEFCAQRLGETFIRTKSYQAGGPVEEALRETFFILDEELSKSADTRMGCTATVAVLVGNRMVVAAVGDSRCVMVRAGRPLALTVDHKPDEPRERERITQAGGIVLQGRVMASLNMSRALGDHQYKDDPHRPAAMQMVSPEPDVHSVTITGDDDFLVLACDGVWNSMSEQKVADFVSKRLRKTSVGHAAQELAAECCKPGSTAYDNVTAIVVRFKKLTPPPISVQQPEQQLPPQTQAQAHSGPDVPYVP